MAFEIVKAETRLANIVAWYAGIQKKITDFVVGSKVRTKLEAIAVEMEAQDFNIFCGIKKAIPTSIYNTFEFSLLAATKASGEVTFTASPTPATDILIPKGTQVSTLATGTSAAIIYETQADATLTAGTTTKSVQVACTTAGTVGNTGSATITVMKSLVSGIVSVSNTNPLSNGTDTETEDQRRLRFIEYISTLTRGTADALVFAAKTSALTDANGNITEQVTAAIVDGPPTSGAAGFCSVYVFNGTTGASANLVTRAQQVIDGYYTADGTPVPGYKAAGVIVTVAAVVVDTQAVTGTATIKPGYDATTVKANVVTAIQQYLLGLAISEKLIWAALVERAMSVDGMLNLTLPTPAGDVTPATGHIIRPGTITVN